MAAGAAMNVPDDDLNQNGVATYPLGQAPAAPPLTVSTQGLDSSDAGAQDAASASPTAAQARAAFDQQGQPEQNQIQQPQQQPGQKGQIPTPPPAQYDSKKLAKANTTLDIVNAMKPQSRRDYMNWWEQQHGDINDRYDQLQQQIGARPADQGLSKKEKFAALLEFGLHLLKASSQPTPNQGAVLTGTLADSVDNTLQTHQAGVQQAQKDYDEQSNEIEQQRAAALKQLGTPSQAAEAQARLTAADAAANKQQKPPALPKPNVPTYITGEDGMLYAAVQGQDGNVEAKPVLGIDGKPIKGRVLGRATGSGVPNNGTTAQMRNFNYLTKVLGMDADTAQRVAFHNRSGDPSVDHAAIYRATLSATEGDAQAAQRAADQYVLDNYGAAGLARMRATNTQPTVPRPASDYDLKGLKPGYVRKFPDGSRWTLGIDGKPVRLGADFGAQK